MIVDAKNQCLCGFERANLEWVLTCTRMQILESQDFAPRRCGPIPTSCVITNPRLISQASEKKGKTVIGIVCVCDVRICTASLLPSRNRQYPADSDARSRRHDRSRGRIARSEHLMNHSFLHARLNQSRRLLGHDWMAEIGALPLAASVALKEVELRCRLHSYCNDSLL